MAKDMPGAAPAPTARQMVQSPMGLRSAMKRYADGGDIPVLPPMATSAMPDYSRAYGALGGAEGVNALRSQFLGMGLDENTINSVFSQYYAPETSQPAPQTRTPPEEPRGYRFHGDPEEPMRPRPDPRYPDTAPPRPEETFNPRPDPRPDPLPEMPEIYPVGVNSDTRLDPPVMPEVYPQDYAGPRTTGSTQTQQVGPRTSYRQEADGTRTEIGYDGQPISGYTAQQLAMHNATTGVTPSEYQYVYNGQGYDKVRTPQTTEESLSPYLPTFTPPNSTIPPALLKKIQEMGNTFGSPEDSQQLAQLLRSLGYGK